MRTLAGGASIDIANEDGLTALRIAELFDQHDAVAVLVDAASGRVDTREEK